VDAERLGVTDALGLCVGEAQKVGERDAEGDEVALALRQPVAEALARGWKSVRPETECTFAPIADGGEGFSEAFAQALGAEWIALDSVDALGRPIRARYAWVGAERTAVIEMSEASGLWRIGPSERDPRRANTYGTGVLLRDAVERGAQRILLGLGGSATTDGGAGMAAAMGYRFLAAGSGEVLEPFPCHFAKIGRIDASAVPDLPEIIAACDVQNPLLGPRGTAAVFSPQKGADPETVGFLEGALAHFAQVVEGGMGRECRDVPGAGAAGGIGFGLLSFCGASLEPGFEMVARAMQLEQRMAAADLVFTGEGRLDAQTLDGKGPAGVAAMARTGSPMSTSSALPRSRVRTANTFSPAPTNTRSPTLAAVRCRASAMVRSSSPMANDRVSEMVCCGGRTRHTITRSLRAPATMSEPSACAYNACAGSGGVMRQSPPLGVKRTISPTELRPKIEPPSADDTIRTVSLRMVVTLPRRRSMRTGAPPVSIAAR
jgi:glycerate kinase